MFFFFFFHWPLQELRVVAKLEEDGGLKTRVDGGLDAAEETGGDFLSVFDLVSECLDGLECDSEHITLLILKVEVEKVLGMSVSFFGLLKGNTKSGELKKKKKESKKASKIRERKEKKGQTVVDGG